MYVHTNLKAADIQGGICTFSRQIIRSEDVELQGCRMFKAGWIKTFKTRREGISNEKGVELIQMIDGQIWEIEY